LPRVISIRSMLWRGIAARSTPTRSRSVTRRPLINTSVLEDAAAPNPRMSTMLRAPFTPPCKLETWMPGSRDRMSGSVCTGERSISSEVMIVVEVPAIPVPSRLAVTKSDGNSVGCCARALSTIISPASTKLPVNKRFFDPIARSFVDVRTSRKRRG
jgi:hypothetical protein